MSKIKTEENKPLKELNTFHIDVKAAKYCEIKSKKDILELSENDDFKSEKLVLGGGSNILFTKDFAGLVIKNNIKGIEILSEDENSVKIKAGAGVVWDDLVKFCVEKEFYGIENLSLIPGTVGAAPIQNIGAYGTELSDVLFEVEFYDTEEQKFRSLEKDYCKLDYRNSIFKKELKNKIIITSVTLELSLEKSFNLSYRALQKEFEERSIDNIALSEVRDKIIQIRNSKLPSTDLYGNAGSFFKNPEITVSHFEKLKKKFPDIVYFETGKDKVKVPAGWLIETAGMKGKRIGNTGTYPEQALVIINYGNADGSEVKRFAEKIISEIDNKFGITLIPEVNIL